MSVWLALRLGKFVAMIALAMGVALGLARGDTGDSKAEGLRRRAVYWLATPAWILTWITGWGMARLHAISLGSPWISVSMLASLIAMHELIRDVEPGRPRSRVRVAVILTTLFISVAAMVIRDGV